MHGHDASADGRPFDDVLDALSHAVRRQIVTKLVERGPEPEMTLTEFVRCREESGRLEVAYRHKHLPKLDETGLVDWDPESGRIRRGESFDEVADLVTRLNEMEAEQFGDEP